MPWNHIGYYYGIFGSKTYACVHILKYVSITDAYVTCTCCRTVFTYNLSFNYKNTQKELATEEVGQK